jgi:hypothetical protein
MNRLLFVPCVASCLGFVFLACSSSLEKESGASVPGKVSAAGAHAEARALMSAEQIQDDLLDRWNRYRQSRNAFSRVYRPERHQTPGILVNDTLPSPEGSFVGVVTLQEQQLESSPAINPRGEPKQTEPAKLEYPIVVDRRSGDAMVFAAGQWTDFNQWAVNGN